MRFLILIGVLMNMIPTHANPLKVGMYKIAINFSQGQEFIDYLSVEDSNQGFFTVPGSFTSRVNFEGERESFSFVLRAKEGERDIVLNFKGSSIDDGGSLKGEIVEPSNNSIIGKFKGVKLYESKQDCGDYLIPY